jgi:hypothetical protein
MIGSQPAREVEVGSPSGAWLPHTVMRYARHSVANVVSL